MALLSAILAGCIFFPASYVCARSWLARTWPNLTAADRAVLSQRAVTAIHGFLACSAGVSIVSSCFGDVMHNRHWTADWYAGFCLPFFMFDIWAMYESESCKAAGASGGDGRLPWTTFLAKRGSMVAHHVTIAPIVLVTTIFRRGLGDFFIGCFFLFEVSAPFKSLKHVLIQLKMTGTRLYTTNEIAIFVTFCLCRSAIFPFMLWSYGQQYGLQIMDVPYRIPWKCSVGSAAVMTFQLYWMTRMLLDGCRAITRKVSKIHKE